MAPGKVANIIPKDASGNPFLFDEDGKPIKFHAEFNDAIFNGNVSGLSGTFSGTLTADAVDAVGNVTIRGESIAITVVVMMDVVGFSEVALVIEVPENESGVVFLSLQMRLLGPYFNKWGDYYRAAFSFFHNEEMLFVTSEATAFELGMTSPFIIEHLIEVSAGRNTFTVGGMAGFDVKDLVFRGDFIRKV